MTIELNHRRNVELFGKYREIEFELMESLARFDESRGYQVMGYSSLFDYCLKGLGMSERQAATFIRVSRKAVEVPQLKEAIKEKKISMSSARVIAPVLNQKNQSEWLEKAQTLPKALLEREVASINPKLAKPDRIIPINATQSQAIIVLSEEARLIVERVKELEGHCDFDAAIIAMGKEYLKKKDPVQRSLRLVRAIDPGVSKNIRRRIPMGVVHQVNHRDRGQCRVENCCSKSFTQIHHIKPFRLGGSHELENLATLCSGHHRALHKGAALRLKNFGF